jgi:hypothetical protein
MFGIDGDDDGRWGAPCFARPDVGVELKRDSFSRCNVRTPPPVPGNLLSTFKRSMLHVRHARRLQGRPWGAGARGVVSLGSRPRSPVGPTTPCHLGDTAPPQEAGRHAPVQCSCCVRQQEQVLLTGSSSSVLCKSKQTIPAETKSDLAQFGIGGKERGEDAVLTVGVGLGRRCAMVRLLGAAAFGTSGRHGVGGGRAGGGASATANCSSYTIEALEPGLRRLRGWPASGAVEPGLQRLRGWLASGAVELGLRRLRGRPASGRGPRVKCCPSRMGRSEWKLVSGALTCAIVRI